MVKPIEVKAISKYLIWIRFQDGIEGEADLSDSAGKGIFKYWDVGDNFSKVYINKETGGIAWSDELEICPDTVYEQIKADSKVSI